MVDVAFVIEPNGEVLAVMPGMAATVGNIDHVTCYAHIGQHVAADIAYITDDCKQASASDYADLLDELMGRDYEVNVISIDRVGHDNYRDARRRELGLGGL